MTQKPPSRWAVLSVSIALVSLLYIFYSRRKDEEESETDTELCEAIEKVVEEPLDIDSKYDLEDLTFLMWNQTMEDGVADTSTIYHAGKVTLKDVKPLRTQEDPRTDYQHSGLQLQRSAAEENNAHNQLPEKTNIFVKSSGCSHNTSDAEYMMGLLRESGYRLVESLEESNLCLFNSCTVKNPSQDSFVNLIAKAKKHDKRVVVSGCVPQADRKLDALEGLSIVGVTQIDRIVEVVEETLRGNSVRLLAKKSLPSLDLPKVRRNPQIEIISLSTGCLGGCTYCKTRHARGVLGSYQTAAILRRMEAAASDGVSQVWFTSEDTGAYGLDIGTNIATLLEAAVCCLEKIEIDTGRPLMLRLGMTNPPYMKAHVERIAKVLKHPNVFEFLHIPVQSGSSETLKHMVREYTSEDFVFLVDTLRRLVPNITIATDIICGFPTDTEADQLLTLELLRNFKFPVVNISQFYPRPGTPAAKMKRVSTKTVKKWSSEVTALFGSYGTHEYLLGATLQVWFSDTSDRSHHTVGHTKQYTKVLVPRNDHLLGQTKICKITETAKWHVVGEVEGT